MNQSGGLNMPSKEGQSLSKGLENNPNQPSALQPTSSFSLSQVGKKRSSQVKIADGVSMHTDKSPLKNGTLGEGSPIGTSKSGSGAMITGVDIAKNPSEQEDNIIFEVNLVPVEILLKNIDGSVPMDEFTAAKFSRVKNNILSALTFLRENKKTGVDTTKDLNSLSVWKKLIGSKFNEDIINDGFWLVVLKKNTEKFALEGSSSGGLLKKKTGIQGQPCLKGKTQGSRGGSLGGQGFSAQYEAVENALLDRMACSYHDMMEEFQGEEYKLFFQIYFDIVAQGVFYSFFYAFPKSRQEFDDKYKRYVFSIFTDLFTNMDISYHSNFIKGYKFIDGWKLDLGAGDVLKQIQRDSECIDSDNEEDPHKKAANNGARNHLRGQPTKKKVQLKKLRYSPILKRYLDLKGYKTRNFLKPNTMKLTPYDESQQEYEKKLETYAQVMDGAHELAKKFQDLLDTNQLYKEMNDSIKAIKKKTLLHNKMLDEKRREEIEKGGYEYANYLVSMFNAGTNNYIMDQ